MGSSFRQCGSVHSDDSHGICSYSQQRTVHLAGVQGEPLLRRLPRSFHGRGYDPRSDQDSSEVYCKDNRLFEITPPVHDYSFLVYSIYSQRSSKQLYLLRLLLRHPLLGNC